MYLMAVLLLVASQQIFIPIYSHTASVSFDLAKSLHANAIACSDSSHVMLLSHMTPLSHDQSVEVDSFCRRNISVLRYAIILCYKMRSHHFIFNLVVSVMNVKSRTGVFSSMYEKRA
ncbi:hypothetical protein HELRODRAFT_164045 [Helobdella robusta]|uniref:Secreted protein n=1 Tax=Helobdella robusta TaxID=6412 RepID=T1EUT6_HELRO|nr:hypothetical protein HELRODRAFT_164045 [Helobdella robusta]ESN94240.1 hypothetical protein HELRODRAFT_164045 [Helobdella robusta]